MTSFVYYQMACPSWCVVLLCSCGDSWRRRCAKSVMMWNCTLVTSLV